MPGLESYPKTEILHFSTVGFFHESRSDETLQVDISVLSLHESWAVFEKWGKWHFEGVALSAHRTESVSVIGRELQFYSVRLQMVKLL